jgi:hypothetical protein
MKKLNHNQNLKDEIVVAEFLHVIEIVQQITTKNLPTNKLKMTNVIL